MKSCRLFDAVIVLLVALAPTTARAAPDREWVQIEPGQPIVLKSDRAYLLLRRWQPEGAVKVEPILLRVPTPQELEQYDAAKREAFDKARPALLAARDKQLAKKAEADAAGKPFNGAVPPEPSLENFSFDYQAVANVQSVRIGKALTRAQPESVYLIETVPGDYVFYGMSWGLARSSLFTCLCLGTVGFHAEAGVVTDLGTFLGDSAKSESHIPELKPESGFGPSSDAFFPLLVGGLRLPAPGAAMPDTLHSLKVVLADYHAVGRFLDGRALGINRMVPVPGVLAYDNGKVIDVRSGQVAADHF